MPKTGKTQKQMRTQQNCPETHSTRQWQRVDKEEEEAAKEEAPVVHGPDVDLDGDGRSGSLGSSGSLSSTSGDAV